MSDNNNPQIKYDVFVSFRGKDIRDGFLSHLTRAFHTKQINAFVDDKLEKGEEIWPSLVAAIERSAISLIIFSPDYASSHWCLKEIAKIIECQEKYGRTVIPVFYKVTPTDVRHQSGRYQKAFAEHATKHETELQLWKRALDKSASFSGMESTKYQLDKSVKVGDLKSLLKDNENDNSVAFELKRLEDKALITISKDNIVCMHDSLQEMGWEIVRQESIDDPGSRSRLWDPNDIYEALLSKAIRSIQLPLTPIKKQKLSAHQIFAMLRRAKFVEIFGTRANLPTSERRFRADGVKFMGTELRFLFWENYPLRSLPESLNAEKLVILIMNEGKLENLWDGVKNVVNLKKLDLSWSRMLKELPDLSRAKNLEELNVRGCVMLACVHSSIFSLRKLERLDLANCTSLTVLASNSHLLSLRYLNLICCDNLKKFSVISENLKELNFGGTKLKALPSSFGDQPKLESLCISETGIERLPSLNNLGQLLKENKKLVLFSDSVMLDERAIGFNAKINIMKFANQHLSAPNHNPVKNYGYRDAYTRSDRCVYMYPGNSFPEWLEYSTGKDCITIDLSSAPPSPELGFIFSFILDMSSITTNLQYPMINNLQCRITTFDGEDGGKSDSFRMPIPYGNLYVGSNYVCMIIYDQTCSEFLNTRAKNQTKFKIQVTMVHPSKNPHTTILIQQMLKRFGVSPISTSAYEAFIGQIELGDSKSEFH
ncbi:unnamed protein product [Sphenostylis stenocarpa]|uniref:TIR domain-containing protein n=1 Tax=Sphenostylis stenocarpa TaxID=92480 RepID=A0AA86T7C3_9FABA|nr:unnamed protein product [Sphenostylis stenocarpa]